jgi:hypothetical protein
MGSFITLEAEKNLTNAGMLNGVYVNLAGSASTVSHSGIWTGGEIRLKSSGAFTFSVPTGKIIDTWLNFDVD